MRFAATRILNLEPGRQKPISGGVRLKRLYMRLLRQAWLRKVIVTAPVLREIAWRYVAGENIEAALATIRALNSRGIKATLHCIGTHVQSTAEAVAAADAAIESLRRIHLEGLDSNISIKLTKIGLDVSEERCRTELHRILRSAREAGNFVRIDMEESAYTERTLILFEEMQREYGPDTVGVVVQSYLRNRRGDLERLTARGARIRLVKGGYWEPEAVAYRKRAEIDAAFDRDLDLLLRHGRHPAIATHDVRFMARAQDVAAAIGLNKREYEFEMLYGTRPDLQDQLARQGHIVRCYVPYGSEWCQYAIGCVRHAASGLLRRFGRSGADPLRPVT